MPAAVSSMIYQSHCDLRRSQASPASKFQSGRFQCRTSSPCPTSRRGWRNWPDGTHTLQCPSLPACALPACDALNCETCLACGQPRPPDGVADLVAQMRTQLETACLEDGDRVLPRPHGGPALRHRAKAIA